MSRVIRISDETYKLLEQVGVQIAIANASVKNLSDDVAVKAAAKHFLGYAVVSQPSGNVSRPSKVSAPPSGSTATRPQSSVPEVQKLIDGILNGVESILGPMTLTHTASGRWVSQPKNFFTIKVQDARNRDLAVTVYGEPHEFSNSSPSLSIKMDRPSYSRFNVKDQGQIQEAIEVICTSDALR
jgi:hypothetical protein